MQVHLPLKVRFIQGGPPRKTDKWAEIAADLMSAPGEWAVVEEKERDGYDRELLSKASYVNSGKSRYMPRGQFEAKVRGNELYARFIGNREREVTIK